MCNNYGVSSMTPAICWVCESMPVNTSGHTRSTSGMCILCIKLAGIGWYKFDIAHKIQLVQLHVAEKLVCACGAGYASVIDGNCKFCREHLVSRSVGKSLGVRHRGDGMRLESWLKYLQSKPANIKRP